METLKISVVIPCYNAGAFISDAISSVISQTFPPYETIVVDDGSSDDTLQQLQAWKDEVKVLHSPRKGGAGARNIGIQAATGQWIAFLDADDVWYPEHLQRAMETIRSHRGLSGYINHYDEQVLPEREIKKRHWPFDGPVTGKGLSEYIEVYLRYGNFVGMSACLIAKEALKEVDYLDESMVRRHDIDCWLRVVRGRRWVFDHVTTSLYRKNREGSLSEHKASINLYRFLAFRKHAAELKGDPSYELLLNQLARKALRNSYRFGSDVEREQTHHLVYAFLDRRNKVLYGLLRPFPFLFRPLKRAGIV